MKLTSTFRFACGAAALTTLFLSAPSGHADAAAGTAAAGTSSCPVADYFANWFTRASEIQSEQPRWVTPLVTVTPRLEQELRYDQTWSALPGGHSLENYGSGKGVELIPFDNAEFIIGIPAWESENTKIAKRGWSDESFLVKYRILSANEDNGDYILTAFMGLSVPDGSDDYTSHHYAFTPTIAGGKGWGPFDVQSTLGVTVPDNGGVRSGSGTPVAWNTAFQYRALKYLNPEVEANYTYWPTGEREGRSQLFLTPGLIIGRIPIYNRLGLTFGAGFQVAVTEKPVDHRNIILTARMPF